MNEFAGIDATAMARGITGGRSSEKRITLTKERGTEGAVGARPAESRWPRETCRAMRPQDRDIRHLVVRRAPEAAADSPLI